MWVYVKVRGESLWTVGFFGHPDADFPRGEWYTDSDHSSKDEAARRCNYLNGGRGNYYSA